MSTYTVLLRLMIEAEDLPAAHSAGQGICDQALTEGTASAAIVLDSCPQLDEELAQGIRSIATDQYEDYDLEIAENGLVTESGDPGYWVEARVWVRKEIPEEHEEVLARGYF